MYHTWREVLRTEVAETRVDEGAKAAADASKGDDERRAPKVVSEPQASR
jgi:hypothetical protein